MNYQSMHQCQLTKVIVLTIYNGHFAVSTKNAQHGIDSPDVM